jgi:hypothetical protein
MKSRRLVLLLAIAAALAAFSAWVDSGRYPGTSQEIGQSASAGLPTAAIQMRELAPGPRREVSLNPLSDIEPEKFSEIVDRPLFNPTRAPAAIEPPAEPEPVVETAPPPAEVTINPGDFTLMAIASDGNVMTAVVRSNVSNEVFHLKPGQLISDLQVVEIGPREITLAKQGQSFKLELFQKPVGLAPHDDTETAGAAQVEGIEDGSAGPGEQ